MNRRKFLWSVGGAAAIAVTTPAFYIGFRQAAPVPFEDMDFGYAELNRSINLLSMPTPDLELYLDEFRTFERSAFDGVLAYDCASYLDPANDWDHSHRDDRYLDAGECQVLVSAFKRLDRLQRLVGHGNFNVLSFDEARRFARRYETVGAFDRAEEQFIESMFLADAAEYGFRGERVVQEMTASVSDDESINIDDSGQHLFRGEAELMFKRLRHDIGDEVILTSGIRSVVKQTYLFLAKTIQTRGNLSCASRSLAPPAYSFHSAGDFDIGMQGMGRVNFTHGFTRTAVFERLKMLGYAGVRYPEGNTLGVRYEPWHIKVV